MIAAMLPQPVHIQPATPATWLTLIIERWLRDLAENDVPEPLTQCLSVAAVVLDLCTLAECAIPPAAVELIGGAR